LQITAINNAVVKINVFIFIKLNVLKKKLAIKQMKTSKIQGRRQQKTQRTNTQNIQKESTPYLPTKNTLIISLEIDP